nr:MaoC family dehydratase N-terminal domain-containing protein [Rhodococcus opacus PD630]
MRTFWADSLEQWGPHLRSGGAISENSVWDFLACVEDANPAYWSHEWAREHAPTGRVTVPPQMLLTHSRFPPGPIGTCAEWEPSYVVNSAPPDPLRGVLDSLCETGLDVYTNAARQETYLAPVHPGDVLATSARIEISPVKTTWLGQGVFVNTNARYRRESDHTVVAESTNSLFVYSSSHLPHATPSRHEERREPLAPEPPRVSPGGRQTSAHFESLAITGISVGQALPPLRLTPTFRDLIRAAQGTRHPVPMHTESAYAQAAGNRDAYFSTLWQAGILGRFVTDWSGPLGELTYLAFSMIDNICAGDEVTVSGTITNITSESASLDLRITNQFGVTTTGTARARLPEHPE